MLQNYNKKNFKHIEQHILLYISQVYAIISNNIFRSFIYKAWKNSFFGKLDRILNEN